jgi:APA family basic amino acid/polyamine antiporter
VVFTGLKPYERLATAAPAATALSQTPFPAAPFVDPLASLVGLTGVVMIPGQSRLAFAVSRGNLLPPRLARVHASFLAPLTGSPIITGIVASILALSLPLTTPGELVNIGMLAALVLVSPGRSGRSGFRQSPSAASL